MTEKNWIDLLAGAVTTRGMEQVRKELGYSTTTISLALAGKYPGDTAKVQRKVLAIYGASAIECPVLGAIKPDRCAEAFNRAKKVGTRLSNPDTIRLHYNCLKCSLRG